MTNSEQDARVIFEISNTTLYKFNIPIWSRKRARPESYCIKYKQRWDSVKIDGARWRLRNCHIKYKQQILVISEGDKDITVSNTSNKYKQQVLVMSVGVDKQVGDRYVLWATSVQTIEVCGEKMNVWAMKALLHQIQAIKTSRTSWWCRWAIKASLYQIQVTGSGEVGRR